MRNRIAALDVIDKTELTTLDKKFSLLLWPVVNSPGFHHGSCQTLESKILRNLEVLAWNHWSRGNGRIGRMNVFLHTSLSRSLLSISPTTYLSISVLEALCTELCSKRSNVQSILSFALLVSMNQLGRQAAKTAGNGVELNWSWKKQGFYLFFQKEVSANISSPPCLMTLLAQQ